jgi:hypothetical protein
MFFIKKENNEFTEHELIANPKIIKKIKKMDEDELLIFIDGAIIKNEIIKIKEILNNESESRVNLIYNHLKSSTILTKRNEQFLFLSNFNSTIYNDNNNYFKEINKNTDW